MVGVLRSLAIETSGRVGSIAIAQDGIVRAEAEFEHGLEHAAKILPMIDSLCRRAEWTGGQIDELYVSTGPGSFTGLRIGINCSSKRMMR